MQLKGHQIVLVLLGTPSAMESNSVLVAALKYGVPAVLLPDTMANEPRLMAVPQTELQVEFARDPLSLALSRADELSMEVIAVYQTNDFAPDATSLFLFSHPARALYLFAPPSQEEALAPAIARTAAAPIFVGAVRRLERGIPANECLYDRLTKTQG
ncbi:unnamed protein product [Phytomonas sp. EM1]|nr:unnamed protein product [Phytomonas sp. EM1]|eukprot:CCW64106.1 unnamed protein product [Phytomonas sp. isolate EM1]